jgi:hypothetical protein
MAKDPLVPVNTPFGYNVGINYESWENGRTGYNIAADVNAITKYFGLIKTFHDVAVGTANPNDPIIDPTQQAVINAVLKKSNVQLAMGTLNNALAQGGFGTPWSPGLMTSSAYTDKWVQMIISSFGSTQSVQSHLKMILLGNEIDQNGPPPSDPSFASYQQWIQQSFTNLSASLKKFGLGSIPVSTTIANYGVSNAIAVNTTAFIIGNWSKSWNGNKPIVLFNQYTPATNKGPMSGTDYKPVINYFEGVYTQLNGKVEPFIGETGYSSFYGQNNQVTVYNQITKWLTSQYNNGGRTVPLFAFDAFDQPSRTPPLEVSFGIFNQNASHQPNGLKKGLTLPAWFSKPISLAANDRVHVYGGTFGDDVTIDAESGRDKLVLAEPATVNFGRGTLANIERLVGSPGDDVVTLSAVQFLDINTIDLRQGTDTLDVVARGDVDFTPSIPILVDTEVRNLRGDGKVSLTLDQVRRFTSIEASLEVVLTDWAAKLEALTPAEFADLAAKGVDRIDALGERHTISILKHLGPGPVLTPGDDVTLADTGANIAGVPDFSTLGSGGIDRIDATDGTLSITVAQYRALGDVRLVADDVVTIADTGANIASLSAAEIAGLARDGIDRLDATDDALTLVIEQFSVLGPVVIASGDALTVNGTAGDDRFTFDKQTFGVADQAHGGDGTDALYLDGAGYASLAFAATTIVDIERLGFAAGNDYGVTLADANLADGRRLGVNGAHLDALDSLTFDASAETDGTFRFHGGDGTTRFTGGDGADEVIAGGGAETIRYTAASQSTGPGYDTIDGFDAGLDKFDVGDIAAVSAVDAPVTTGALGKATFDADLSVAMATLAAGHAGLFTADTGNLAGVAFLVVDANGTAGYQGGSDLAIRLDHLTGSIGFGNFS